MGTHNIVLLYITCTDRRASETKGVGWSRLILFQEMTANSITKFYSALFIFSTSNPSILGVLPTIVDILHKKYFDFLQRKVYYELFKNIINKMIE